MEPSWASKIDLLKIIFLMGHTFFSFSIFYHQNSGLTFGWQLTKWKENLNIIPPLPCGHTLWEFLKSSSFWKLL